MGEILDIFTPDVPKAPPVFPASDGSIHPSQAEADARNVLVEKTNQQNQARTRGYAGEFGGGGYARYLQDYEKDPNNPTGRYVGKNAGNTSRAGIDKTADRTAARDAGYTGTFGSGGYEAFKRNQAATAAAAENKTYLDQSLQGVKDQRVADDKFFNDRLAQIEADRVDIAKTIPQQTNETSNKSARSVLYKRLFGRRSLLSSNSTGYASELGG